MSGISIVIPCLNEEYTLERCIQNARKFFEAMGIEGEVVVADNNSVDSSRAIAEKAGAVVVKVETLGYGAALKQGIFAATGDIIIIGDADCSYDFLEAIALVNTLHQDNLDLVMGSRLRGNIEPGAMPLLHRYFGTPFLTFLINTCFKSNFTDINCGLRVFKKDAYTSLSVQSDGMEFASDMIIESLKNNLAIAEIPINFYRDKRISSPRLRPFRDGLRHLKLIASKL